eukprot:7133383-Pyramimonas_sp.AAC.1
MLPTLKTCCYSLVAYSHTLATTGLDLIGGVRPRGSGRRTSRRRSNWSWGSFSWTGAVQDVSCQNSTGRLGGLRFPIGLSGSWGVFLARCTLAFPKPLRLENSRRSGALAK